MVPTSSSPPERRRAADTRLDAIAEDIAAIRDDFTRFVTAQHALNEHMNAHMTRSDVLGGQHTELFRRLEGTVERQEEDIRQLSNWRQRLDTYGTVLKLTFGASVIGAIVGILALINSLLVLGR